MSSVGRGPYARTQSRRVALGPRDGLSKGKGRTKRKGDRKRLDREMRHVQLVGASG